VLGTTLPGATLAGTTTYTYDATGRLTTVAAPNALDVSTATITYDRGDNRTSIVYGYQDKTPPNSPTSLSATPEAWNWIQLHWTTSLDMGGGPVASYKVYRGGSFLSSVSGPPYNDQSLQGNTPYSYTVSAVDPSGNESTQAGPVSATTPPPPDTTPPSVPTNLGGVAVSGTQINLTWTGSTDTGGSGLAGYQIFRNGGTSSIGTSTVASYSDTTASSAAMYTYAVLAYDNAGNKSVLSSQVSVTTPDSVRPSTPGTPSFSSVTTSSAVASWVQATDNVGVTQYKYSFNGGGSWTLITSWTTVGNTVSINLTGLAQSTIYTMIVEAGDAAGNWGFPSGGGSFTTAGPITDNLSFVPGSWQIGTYPNLTVYSGYIEGSYGTFTPGATSNGKTIQILQSSYNVSTGVSWTALSITGFSSSPGAGWLTSVAVSATGVTLTGATAIFTYSSGAGIWQWQTAAGDLGQGTVTIVHY
jgi:YD repeat-containing protein